MVVNSMSYEKYESYQASGVDWLGEIPSDWELLKVKNIFRLVMKFAPKNNDCELLSVYTDIGVKPRKELEERGNRATTTDGYLIVEKGDIVVNKLLAWMGAIGLSDYDGVTSPAYDILKPKIPIEGIFYHWLFRSPQCTSELRRYSRGIMDMRLRLYFDKFGDVVVPYPNIKVQKKIVSFLAEKTAQIDQAIALKQQQIEKLGEYKQIVIQNAVTKGLNPNAPMKNSGVEWIGDIPEHWEMVSIKRIAKISPKVDLSNYKLDEKVTFLPMEKVSSNGDIDCEILKPIREVKQGFTAFKKNDVILAKITPCFENGKGALLDKLETEIGYGSTEFHVLRASKRIKAYYLYLITHSSNFLTLGEAMMTGSAGQKRVPTDFVANYQFPLPPMSEQQQIIEYVENLNRKISDTIQSYQTQIDRLKEYKNILINQAVTGKIKI